MNNRFEFYETNSNKIYGQYYGPLVHNSSRWKVFFNETPYKLVKTKYNIKYETDDINFKPVREFNCIMDKGDYDMSTFFRMANYIIEIDSIILNDKNVDPPKYEDLESYNEMVINVSVVKKIETKNEVKSVYNDYCSIC